MIRRAAQVGLVVVFLACRATQPLSTPNVGPKARLVVPAIAREGAAVSFRAEGSADPNGDSVTYVWNFGDGTELVTSDSMVEHRFRDDGTYIATLLVRDAFGAIDSTMKSVVVANVEPQVSRFDVPDTIAAGTLAAIEVRYFDPGMDDTVRASLWISRETGATGTALDSSGIYQFLFLEPGTYTVSLTLRDNDGAIVDRKSDHPVIAVQR